MDSSNCTTDVTTPAFVAFRGAAAHAVGGCGTRYVSLSSTPISRSFALKHRELANLPTVSLREAGYKCRDKEQLN